jgi:hypothetical protein
MIYYISAVRYNTERTHIVLVRRHTSLYERGTPETREDVLRDLKIGVTYYTAPRINGVLTTGDKIVPYGEFITTAGNHTLIDNLGELPEF